MGQWYSVTMLLVLVASRHRGNGSIIFNVKMLLVLAASRHGAMVQCDYVACFGGQ